MSSMRSSWRLVAMLAAAVAAAQCSGSSNNNSNGGGTVQNPITPAPTPTAVTISIVGTAGNQSYVPNPVPVSAGEQVIFRNNDTVVHRIVMNDGSADFGNLSPGQSSQARGAGSGDFHCTIHPSMVGSINGLTAPEPPPGSGDGY
jgi:plastocyanin